MVTWETWKKSPANWLTGSLKPSMLRVTLLHSMSTESIIAAANPIGRAILRLLGTVNASNTEQMFLAENLAVPRARSTLAAPPAQESPKKRSFERFLRPMNGGQVGCLANPT